MLADDYNKEFFDMHVPWRADYELFAQILTRYFCIKSAIDFGCGNGYLLSALKPYGVEALGLDGSPCADGYVDNLVVIQADLSQPRLSGGRRYDTVLCLEVAEHIPPEAADVLLQNLANAASGLIIFSAAAPGYGGHLHLNEQPKEYWRNKFSQYGYNEDRGTTMAIAEELRTGIQHTWWFAQNLMIMRNYRVGVED